MISARADAARRAEVRTAARAWHAARAIDDATLERIEAVYPDDRHRMAAAWRVLVFVIVTIAANALFFAVATIIHRESGAGPWLVFAAFLTAATEILLHRSRIGENGSAAAASFWAVTYGVVGFALAAQGETHRDWESAVTAALLSSFLLFGAACWRWGYAAYGVFSAVAFFLLLGRFPAGRPAWLLVGAALLVPALRLRERAFLAPSHRNAAGGIFVVATAAVYAAVNRYSLDRHLVESMREGGGTFSEPSPAVAMLSGAATAALPVLLILWGLRSRRTLVLDAGLVAAALSLVTLRYYVHLAPLWILLSAAGAALVLAALWLNRWLRSASGEERHGFTARPLFSPSRSALETVAVVAAFAPEASPAQSREPGGFSPGGGRYGGGGAGGEF